jgi:hypothetical protein
VPWVGQILPCREHSHIDRNIWDNDDLAGVLGRDLQIDSHRGDMNIGSFIAYAGCVEPRQQEAAYQLC